MKWKFEGVKCDICVSVYVRMETLRIYTPNRNDNILECENILVNVW